ncbi:metallophosphoesterase [bacterium]|nr:metallophosphoesterase [bacterium]
MNILYFFIFLFIFVSFYLGIHYYVCLRIISGLTLTPLAGTYLRLFFLFAALSFVLGKLLSRYFSVGPLVYFSSVWMGVIAIAFSLFLLKDIAGLFFIRHNKFLTIITLILVFFISVFSLYNAAGEVKIKEIRIPTKKLPSVKSEFSIVQLSDLHLNSLTSIQWLQSIIDKTNKLNPDLIVITGDLIDQGIHNFENLYQPLKRLKSKYGVIAITGNHEFYAGVNHFLEIAKQSNILVLRNEKISLADTVEIIGIDDETSRRFSEKGPNLKQAMKDCDLNKPVILLSHQPKYFREAVKSGIDLQLSGHTHAGQIPPMDLIVWLVFKYPWGLYQFKNSYIYTTCGTGTWGPPMRLFSRSEIVKITLVSDDKT